MDNNYEIKNVRTAAILTDAYVAGTTIDDTEGYNQLMLFLKYVKGSLTSFEVKVEFSFDGVTFYQETFASISGAISTESAGYHTFAPSGDANFVLSIPIKCHQVKVSVKGTGTVTSSSLEVKAALGNV